MRTWGWALLIAFALAKHSHCHGTDAGYLAVGAGTLGVADIRLEIPEGSADARLPLLEPIRFHMLLNGEPLRPAADAIQTLFPDSGTPTVHRVAAHGPEGFEVPGEIITTTTLTSSTVSIQGVYRSAQPQQVNTSDAGFAFRLPWERDGYDVQGFSQMPFTAIYAEDTGQYIPAEQLKRMHCRTNPIRGEKIVLRTTGSLELVFSSDSGEPLVLHWFMKANSIQFRFWDYKSVPQWSSLAPGEEIPFSLRVEVRSRAMLPDYFPSFGTSEGAIDVDLTSFYRERSHSWTSAMGDWFAWIAPIHSWHGSPFRKHFVKQLLDWKQDDDGYVWTWWNKRGWPFPTDDTKSRHFLANAAYVLAAEELAQWTCDAKFESAVFRNSKRAMDYLRENFCTDEGILVLDLEGHRGRPGEWSSNFYDLHPFGYKDAYINLYYFAALQRIGQWAKQRGETTASMSFRAQAEKIRSGYHATFWDEEHGRFIGWVDSEGNRRDYGYVFLNLEAIYFGLASTDQAKRIFAWLESEVTSSGKSDVFSAWKFAPRLTTIHNTDCLTGLWTATVPYGMQCQNGGTWLHVMFYEIAARAQVFGPEDAYVRFMDLLDRYRAGDRLCGGPPLIHGEIPQLSYKGHDPSGSVGVDEPFPESGLAPSVFVHVFAGVRAVAEGLRIRPCLPARWQWVSISGMNYGGVRLNVRVSSEEVVIHFPDDPERQPVRGTMVAREVLIPRNVLLYSEQGLAVR